MALKKCLICELWWMGDAVLMTSILQGLLADGWEVTVLARIQNRLLLEDDYPTVRWIEFNAPWTALRNKYQLWRWPWLKIFRVLHAIRRERFTAAVSVRSDPRDHFLLWLGGVPRRVSFRSRLSWRFLNDPVPALPPTAHRVDGWWAIQRHLSPTAATLFPPRLTAAPSELERFRALFAADGRPVLALHCGARALVRRWPEPYLRELINRLRAEFDFQLALFPEADGYGAELRDLAEHAFTGLNLKELRRYWRVPRFILATTAGPATWPMRWAFPSSPFLARPIRTNFAPSTNGTSWSCGTSARIIRAPIFAGFPNRTASPNLPPTSCGRRSELTSWKPGFSPIKRCRRRGNLVSARASNLAVF